jgi:hypothetical protein
MEAKKQVEIVENQMMNVRDEFDESIGVCIAQSLRDINGLFDKLGQSGYFLSALPPLPTSCVDIKTKIFHSHKTIVSNIEKIISTHTDSLTENFTNSPSYHRRRLPVW